MKVFVLRASLFFTMVACCYAVMAALLEWNIPTDHKEAIRYFSSTKLKHKRAQDIERPMLLLAGGSNLPYGVNSASLQEALQIPVVNLGQNGSLGLPWILEELRYLADSGDMVVLVPEYYITAKYAVQRQMPMATGKARHFHRTNYIKETSVHIARTRSKLAQYMAGSYVPDTTALLAADTALVNHKGFNGFGDISRYNNIGSYYNAPIGGPRFRAPANWQGTQQLNEFAAYARAHHIEVFYMYPPFSAKLFEKNKVVLEGYHQNDPAHLDLEILGTPYDFLVADTCLYDSQFHLNQNSVEARTTKMIALLQANPKANACAKRIAALYASDS